MRGRRLRRKGRVRDFEIKALDNETVKLEPSLHKVVIGKKYFQLSSLAFLDCRWLSTTILSSNFLYLAVNGS